MKKSFPLPLALLLTLVCAAVTRAQTQPAAPSAADKAAHAKIVQMLEASGHAYSKVKDGVWAVKFKGRQLPEFNVATAYAQDMLIFLAIVAQKGEYKPAVELLQKLLNLNDDFDRVKVGIDGKDGSIFVRIDLSLRVLDAPELKTNLEQISGAADETYAALKPFLLKPAK